MPVLPSPRIPSRDEVTRWGLRASAAVLQRAPMALPPTVGRQVQDLIGRALPMPDGVQLTEEELGGIPALRLAPADPAPGAVVYFHGGGFERGSYETHRGMAAHLAAASGVTVHLPDYRLAPEHAHPAALEDAAAAWGALVDSGIPAERIALGGDSAGGGLALSLTQRLLDIDEPAPALLVLICPWLDLTLSGDSVRDNNFRDAGLSPRWLRRCARSYAGDVPLDDPEISPLFIDPLGALPPIHLQEATEDVLASDAARFARRLVAEGVELDHHRYPQWHAFQLGAGRYPPATAAVGDAARAIVSVLGRHG